jgi:hypothetical protein
MRLSMRGASARQVEICGDMTIELSTAAAAHSLADYLERCGCTVDFRSERVLGVELPARLQSRRDAMIEIHAYLRVWSAMHPGHEVRAVEDA